jgi:hypothetical protein
MLNYYRITDTSDVRDLSDQMAAWVAAGNPKANDWAVQPAAPSADAVWTNGAWSVPPVATFTADQWVDAQGFDGKRPTTCLYLLLQLQAAGKSSPKLAAVQAWMDQLIAAGVMNPDEARSDWPVAPWSFTEASGEALANLNS